MSDSQDGELETAEEVIISIMANFWSKISNFDLEEGKKYLDSEKFKHIFFQVKNFPDLKAELGKLNQSLLNLIDTIGYYKDNEKGDMEEYLQKLKLDNMSVDQKQKIKEKSFTDSVPKSTPVSKPPFQVQSYNKTISTRFFLEKHAPKPVNVEQNKDSKIKESLSNTVTTQIDSIKLVTNIIRTFIQAIQKLQKVRADQSEGDKYCEMPFNDDVFEEIRKFIDDNINSITEEAKLLAESAIINQSYFVFIETFITDAKALSHLLAAHNHILTMDVLSSMSSMLIAKKRIEEIKMTMIKRNQDFSTGGFYAFFVKFWCENQDKSEMIFETYSENKKNFLLQWLTEAEASACQAKSNSNTPDNSVDLSTQSGKKDSFKSAKKKEKEKQAPVEKKLTIFEKVFLLRKKRDPRAIARRLIDEGGMTLHYFVILFQKKGVLDTKGYERKKKRYYKYLSDNFLFVEDEEEYGIPLVLYSKEEYKSIIKDISFNLKISAESTQSAKVQVGNEAYTIDCGKGFYLFFCRLSKHFYLAIKYLAKNSNDIPLLLEALRPFRTQFSAYKALKIIPVQNKNR